MQVLRAKCSISHSRGEVLGFAPRFGRVWMSPEHFLCSGFITGVVKRLLH